ESPIPQLKANHRTRRKRSVAANATGLCLWAQLRASVRGDASSNVANEVPSNKKTLKHYGSMRSLLQAHASPSTSHTIELRNPVNLWISVIKAAPRSGEQPYRQKRFRLSVSIGNSGHICRRNDTIGVFLE